MSRRLTKTERTQLAARVAAESAVGYARELDRQVETSAAHLAAVIKAHEALAARAVRAHASAARASAEHVAIVAAADAAADINAMIRPTGKV